MSRVLRALPLALLVMVLAMALIAFSLCWHPVTVYPSNAPTAQCHFGPIGCHPVAVPPRMWWP
jgi:hypothetical protein